jgi:hypothetical protein
MHKQHTADNLKPMSLGLLLNGIQIIFSIKLAIQ